MVSRPWMRILSGLMLLFMLVACGGEEVEGELGTFESAPESPLRVGSSGGTTGGPAQQLSIGSAEGAILAFDQTELNAETGTIELTFNNNGSVPHNWTLAREGEADSVNSSASGAEYASPEAIGQTETIDGAISTTITFNVSEAGTYTFLCTFPGHYASGMKGTLVVAQGEGGAAASGGEADGPGGSIISNTGDSASFVYEETALNVSNGNVELTFNNNGTIPHNWTLVAEGEEDAIVADSSSNAPGYTSSMAIAQSDMLDGGASQTFSFNVAPGTYTFLCTFPGHYISGMKGTLVVE